MPPERKAQKSMMSVNPPYEVSAALGDYRTVTLTQAVRCAAQLFGDAALEVASKFTPEEWELLAEAYQDRTIEPELHNPEHILADMVERAHARYNIGATLKTKPADTEKAVASVVERIRELDYCQAWAVVIACQFRWRCPVEGKQWWKLEYRRQYLNEARKRSGK